MEGFPTRGQEQNIETAKTKSKPHEPHVILRTAENLGSVIHITCIDRWYFFSAEDPIRSVVSLSSREMPVSFTTDGINLDIYSLSWALPTETKWLNTFRGREKRRTATFVPCPLLASRDRCTSRARH